ncbi:MAG: hypothetical protein EOM11_10665, partial [Erysipelotrichia bacterium]|nr:hypothetical protein [Erysipelotrichia bacterium]
MSEGKEEHIYKILDFVSYDHPELYQYNGMHMYSGNEKSELLVGYGKDERSHKEIVTQLKQIKADVANHIFAGASDYDKIKIVYDYMVERCSYVEGAKNNQNILSSLVDKETVCAGYAKGIQYLLNDLGIPCTYITGEIVAHGEEEGYHAWNMVEVDGNFYYLDATWGDMVEVAPHTCYAYFMMSQSEMMQLYKPDVETMETLLYDNEFIHHHEYLNSYDETILKNIMLRCYQEGRNIMEIKCAPEAFANIEYQLTQNGGIYNVM